LVGYKEEISKDQLQSVLLQISKEE